LWYHGKLSVLWLKTTTLNWSFEKPFREMWDDYKNDPVLGPLSERMGVRNREGKLAVNDEEMDAASFYHCFSFYKV